MNAELESARDDLAFMRNIVSDGGRLQASAGETFLWAGSLYGLQCVGHWSNMVGLLPLNTIGHLALGFGPTALFLGLVAWIVWRDRRMPPSRGVGTRALEAAFQSAGLANLVMAFVFGYGAAKAQNMTIWFYHPIVVCMIQGVAWYVAWRIQRKTWLGLVALGWFASTAALGVLVGTPGMLAVLALTLFLCMALPGYIMLRQSKTV